MKYWQRRRPYDNFMAVLLCQLMQFMLLIQALNNPVATCFQIIYFICQVTSKIWLYWLGNLHIFRFKCMIVSLHYTSISATYLNLYASKFTYYLIFFVLLDFYWYFILMTCCIIQKRIFLENRNVNCCVIEFYLTYFLNSRYNISI